MQVAKWSLRFRTEWFSARLARGEVRHLWWRTKVLLLCGKPFGVRKMGAVNRQLRRAPTNNVIKQRKLRVVVSITNSGSTVRKTKPCRLLPTPPHNALACLVRTTLFRNTECVWAFEVSIERRSILPSRVVYRNRNYRYRRSIDIIYHSSRKCDKQQRRISRASVLQRPHPFHK